MTEAVSSSSVAGGTQQPQQPYSPKVAAGLENTSLFNAYQAAVLTNRAGKSAQDIFSQYAGEDNTLSADEMATALKAIRDENHAQIASDRLTGDAKRDGAPQGTKISQTDERYTRFMQLSSDENIGYSWTGRRGDNQEGVRQDQILSGARDVNKATRVIIDSLDDNEIAALVKGTQPDQPDTAKPKPTAYRGCESARAQQFVTEATLTRARTKAAEENGAEAASQIVTQYINGIKDPQRRAEAVSKILTDSAPATGREAFTPGLTAAIDSLANADAATIQAVETKSGDGFKAALKEAAKTPEGQKKVDTINYKRYEKAANDFFAGIPQDKQGQDRLNWISHELCKIENKEERAAIIAHILRREGVTSFEALGAINAVSDNDILTTVNRHLAGTDKENITKIINGLDIPDDAKEAFRGILPK